HGHAQGRDRRTLRRDFLPHVAVLSGWRRAELPAWQAGQLADDLREGSSRNPDDRRVRVRGKPALARKRGATGLAPGASRRIGSPLSLVAWRDSGSEPYPERYEAYATHRSSHAASAADRPVDRLCPVNA